MAKKKKKYNLDAKIKNALRKLWLWSPERRQALALSVISHKNIVVLDKIRRVVDEYVCSGCEKKKYTSEEKFDLDHVAPVVCPVNGFQGWDVYISRLFCGATGLQVLCKTCHGFKTDKQREVRVKNRKKKK